MGRHWGKGRQQAQRHLDRLAQRGTPGLLAGSFPPRTCPHKLTVWRDGRPIELRCQTKSQHDQHRHGDHTWT